MVRILIIDHDRGVRNTLKEMLEYEGYRVDAAQDYAQGVAMLRAEQYGAVVCDALCRDASAAQADAVTSSGVPLILVSGDPSPSAAIDAIRGGAVDYIVKPIDMNRLLKTVRTVTDPELSEWVPPFVPAPSADGQPPRGRKRGSGAEQIVGRSHSIERVRGMIDKVAPSQARVLITGENGTGKELVARWLHEKSRRVDGPFVEVNCAAIPSELIESELFGHEKGAFTSAIKLRRGKFEQADGGTLFMDEIGDMSLAAQAKVLRVLQERKLSRVGSDRDIEVDVRVVAATNKDLRAEISRNLFREDLYHRLSVIVIRVPALSERTDDIPALVDHFLGQICAEYAIERKKVDPRAIEELKGMPWRGNIRELRNVVERLVILSEKDITLDDVKTYVSQVV